MCHDDDSRAPAPPVRGEVAAHGPLELTSADGTVFSAYEAVPAGFAPGGPGIVLLPDVRGLHPYYRDLARRFAEAGLPAVAIDYFGRTAGTGERGDGFDHKPHVDQVDPANVQADAAAALDRLRTEHGTGPVFTVGFCFGGSQSWRLSASDLDLAGVIGFYGRPALVEDVIGRLHRPMLLLVAGADAATSPEQSDEFEAKLTAQGVEHERVVYEGAPHSFFDRSFARWKDAGADAWRRILDFVATHST
ncbi:MAG TPA: dienelactone hydrolase family protein [Mycobacteriales bacterium]